MSSSSKAGDDKRGEEILSVFGAAFGDLWAKDQSAMENKFRKMAGSPFTFYRGAAPLFYNDVEHEQHGSPYLNDRTNRVWIHGDLHAENFGTYLDSEGHLVFNVNDFDEAYIGPFTWDLKRFAASVALVGYQKALSDDQIASIVRKYAQTYREHVHALASHGENQDAPGFSMDSAKGPLLTALRTARSQTRYGMLDSMTEIRDYERRFSSGGGVVELDDNMRQKVQTAFDGYLKTLPKSRRELRDFYRVKDMVGRRGVGIGSAGLPSYSVLVEGNSDAMENDIVIYMKQAQTPAVSHHIKDKRIREYFLNEGHRTVISQHALQARADPQLGWTELDGKGQLVAEVSPYEQDLEWGDINDPEEIAAVVQDLGRVAATMHAAADEDSEHSKLVPFSTEKAIDEAISADKAGFDDMLVNFAQKYSARVRRDHQIFVDLFRNGRISSLSEYTKT